VTIDLDALDAAAQAATPPTLTFQYDLLADLAAVREQVKACEGRHVQQVAYSSFMNALTQVCFTCQRVRSTVTWEGARSWSPS
jgi:hypothetical protein